MLKKLYSTYLRELCPDWTEERINVEVKSVFREQGLETSKKRRSEFQQRISAKLKVMRQYPDDWPLRNNGYQD